MTLKTLILRNCNINGTLPQRLGTMTSLKKLDLSFNKLSGPIPNSYDPLRKMDYIYLTGNLLTGPVPSWTQKADNLDISYNNFTISQGSQTCLDGNVNLFSTSSTHNDSGKVSCLTSFVCPKTSYALYINCGGKPTTVNGSTYDDDGDAVGPARFHQSGTKNWAFSTTGNLQPDVYAFMAWCFRFDRVF